MEKAEEMLYHFGTLKKRIKYCRENIRELYAEKYSCVDGMLKPPKLGGQSQKTNVHSDPVYNVVQKMVDVYDTRIAEATEYLGKLYSEYDAIERKLDGAGMSGEEMDYLRMRYVEGLSVRAIVIKMNYSERQTQRLRQNVIRTVEKLAV